VDVYHPHARAAGGFRLVGLDDAEGPDGLAGTGRGYTPADAACFRLDFAAWLNGLPDRKRRVAELLAEGYSTGEAARRLGVTPGAVSQARAWLAASWHSFQGDGEPIAGRFAPARAMTDATCPKRFRETWSGGAS
jgi:hypothetical protein